jgi:2-haloacid dehalogenase
MRFDAILGADVAQDYKPKPRVYQASAEAFDLKPSECMMVSAAAHDRDTEGAAKAGLRTATVARPESSDREVLRQRRRCPSISSPRI